MPGAEDGEAGSINFTPQRIRESIDKYIDLSWVPDTFDLDLTVTVSGAATEPARFLATSIGLWLERILAGLVRNYKLMGYEAIVKELRATHRSSAAIKNFTKETFDAIVQAGYHDHEARTSNVLSPGPFLRESRFATVSRFFASAVCGGRWAKVSDEMLVVRLLLMSFVAANQKPEAVHYVLENHIKLIENFPESHSELTILLRDLWAEAPRNKAVAEEQLLKSFGSTREAVEAFLSTLNARKKSTCACSQAAHCRLGRRRPPFVKTTICRAQPWAMHRETSAKTSQSGRIVDDQWRESVADVARIFTDSCAKTELLNAVADGGELDLVAVIQFRTYTKQGQKCRSGIKHAKTVRPHMISRIMHGAWARMSMQRQGLREAVLPGDNAKAPSLAPLPSRRVEAFMENCV